MRHSILRAAIAYLRSIFPRHTRHPYATDSVYRKREWQRFTDDHTR